MRKRVTRRAAGGSNTAVGLERLPRRIAELLDETAANLLACANELDALAHHPTLGDAALVTLRAEQRRIGHDIRHHASRGLLTGGRRIELIALAGTAEQVTDAVAGLGGTWTRSPLGPGIELLQVVRESVRSGARGIAMSGDDPLVLEQIAVCEQREHETRRSLRAARRTPSLVDVGALGEHDERVPPRRP